MKTIEPDFISFEKSGVTGALTIVCNDGTKLVLRNPREAINSLVEFFINCERSEERSRLEADRAAGARYVRPGQEISDVANIRVVSIDHPDADITIAIPADVTRDEARQLGEQLFGGRGVTVPIVLPRSVKTVGGFFGEDMARAIAEQAWNAMSSTCPVCGQETAFPHEH